jgi:hypothetical protein
VITLFKHAKTLKVVELKALLLYIGPVIFKGILSGEQYNDPVATLGSQNSVLSNDVQKIHNSKKMFAIFSF